MLARIYEVRPLVCPLCGADMRTIAFIVDTAIVHDIVAHFGEPTAPPGIAPARGPPLWEAAGAKDDSSPDGAFPPAPAFEFD